MYRIDYTGTCKDPDLALEKTGCGVPGSANYDAALPKEFNDPRKCAGQTSLDRTLPVGDWMRLDGSALEVTVPGKVEVEVIDASGRVVSGVSGEGPKRFNLPELKARGIYRAKVKSSFGTEVRRLPLVGF